VTRQTIQKTMLKQQTQCKAFAKKSLIYSNAAHQLGIRKNHQNPLKAIEHSIGSVKNGNL
jgi:hypothetical protein